MFDVDRLPAFAVGAPASICESRASKAPNVTGMDRTAAAATDAVIKAI